MNRLIYFMTGWLSTLSISNLMGGQGMELWRENLLGVIGGICSAIIVAWLRWRWEHRDRARYVSISDFYCGNIPRLSWPGNVLTIRKIPEKRMFNRKL